MDMIDRSLRLRDLSDGERYFVCCVLCLVPILYKNMR